MEYKINLPLMISHLQTKWQDRACIMCGSKSWNLSDKAYELREFQGGDFVIGSGSVIPLLAVTCTNCGNTILVNAIVAKIVDNQKNEIK